MPLDLPRKSCREGGTDRASQPGQTRNRKRMRNRPVCHEDGHLFQAQTNPPFRNIRQIDEMDCGAASLAMVAALGRKVSLRESQVVHTATTDQVERGL